MLTRFILAGALAGPLSAAIADLRITEVQPGTGVVEITNTAADTFSITDDSVQFCQRGSYVSLRQLNANTDVNFTPGSRVTLTVTFINAADTDLGIYENISTIADFDPPANMLHFVKWGPAANVGRTFIAVNAGLWPSTSDFVPAPPSGSSIAWDEGGFTPEDWYIDATPTPAAADSTVVGSVANNIAWPTGTQTFENVSPGDLVTAMAGWLLVDTGADLTRYWVRGAADGATAGTRPSGTTRWLRIRDQNDTDSNRFYTATVTAPSAPTAYTWTWYFQVEEAAPGTANPAPRFMIQHEAGGFQNVWGIEMGPTQFGLVVTAIGGTAATTPITASTTGTWHRGRLIVEFGATNTVRASIDGGTEVTLPINFAGDTTIFRFCYRGEGTDNSPSVLVDDITFQSGVPSGGGDNGDDDEGDDEGCSTGSSGNSLWLAILAIAGLVGVASAFIKRLGCCPRPRR
jgi:hypothetical protein